MGLFCHVCRSLCIMHVGLICRVYRSLFSYLLRTRLSCMLVSFGIRRSLLSRLLFSFVTHSGLFCRMRWFLLPCL